MEPEPPAPPPAPATNLTIQRRIALQGLASRCPVGQVYEHCVDEVAGWMAIRSSRLKALLTGGLLSLYPSDDIESACAAFLTEVHTTPGFTARFTVDGMSFDERFRALTLPTRQLMAGIGQLPSTPTNFVEAARQVAEAAGRQPASVAESMALALAILFPGHATPDDRLGAFCRVAHERRPSADVPAPPQQRNDPGEADLRPLQPREGDEELQRLARRLKRLAKSDELLPAVLWALANEDDALPAAQVRIAAWLGRPIREVGEQLGDLFANLVPTMSPDAACAVTRSLTRTFGMAPNLTDAARQRHLLGSRTVEYRRTLEEAANESMVRAREILARDHYYMLAVLYPDLPGPEERLKALRHALATDKIDLKLAPVAPRFNDRAAALDSVQVRYTKLSKSQQQRIIEFDKQRAKRPTPGVKLKPELRTQQLLERLFPHVRPDVRSLVDALQFAVEHRMLDLTKR